MLYLPLTPPPNPLLLQIFGRVLPLRSCGLLRLWLSFTPSAKYTKNTEATQFKSAHPLFSSVSLSIGWLEVGSNWFVSSQRHGDRLYQNFVKWELSHNICTCAENAVPCRRVVLPCLGVEALVELDRCDHHHAKCAHHLQEEDKEKTALDLTIVTSAENLCWILAPTALWDLCEPPLIISDDIGLPQKISVNIVKVLHPQLLWSGWTWWTTCSVGLTDLQHTLLLLLLLLLYGWNNNRCTHCFHCCDEVHGLLVDFLLQETKSLVVQDEADGWVTEKSKRKI